MDFRFTEGGSRGIVRSCVLERASVETGNLEMLLWVAPMRRKHRTSQLSRNNYDGHTNLAPSIAPFMASRARPFESIHAPSITHLKLLIETCWRSEFTSNVEILAVTFARQFAAPQAAAKLIASFPVRFLRAT